jgi:hypothetical protein
MLQAYIKDDFKDLLEYQQWVNNSMNQLQYNQRYLEAYSETYINRLIKYDENWFGVGTTFEELQAGVTTYKNPALIETIYEKVNDRVALTVRDKIKDRKVNYNAMGLGIFLFDRAAMGMYRLKEFYSPAHARVVEREEVQQVKKGLRLISDGTSVIERWEEKPDGTPKIRTTSKKVYAYYPKQDKQNRAVEIYLAIGGSSAITAEDFIYSGVSAIIVAQLLEKARVSTKISIVVGTSPDEFKKSVYASIIPVKGYDEKTDANLLALLSSDPRFYRYDGFKGVISTYEHFNAKAPSDIGTGFNERKNLIRTIEQSSYTHTAKLAPNRIYMGRIFSEEEAIRDIEETMQALAEKLNNEDH